jgi:hypothetical protein
MPRRVTVVTAGHLATCPRMLKAADAFHAAGYDIRVISTSQTPWAVRADRELYARRAWRWEVIDYGREAAPARWLMTGARFRAAQALARSLGPRRPLSIAVHAFSRVHSELVRAILREPQDLIYGGTTGAIAAIAEASRISGTPCGVDFEDFHCGEHEPDAHGALLNDLAAQIMGRVVGQATFVTAGSTAIADACAQRFGVTPIAINNVFPLPAEPAVAAGEGPLRLYWFSQTIGRGRGLEDVVRAAGTARIECELHLRGVPANGYVATLQHLAAMTAPRLHLVVHPPADPDSMVDVCRGFDVGISAEQGRVANNALSLSNKALTYPLAGLALALTDTPGQRPLAHDLGGDAIVYTPGDVAQLADGLARWASDRAALRRAGVAAWEAARRRWHWEHPLERDALLYAAARAAA